MKVWQHSRKDVILFGFTVAELIVMVCFAAAWDRPSTGLWLGETAVLSVVMTYNIIVVSHLFTHAPWFVKPSLNAAASLLNSIAIGQSVQAYHLTHVRNHHRFNNDKIDETGVTRDRSSTYRGGRDGEHAPLLRYILTGAMDSIVLRLKESTVMVFRLWRVGPAESNLLELANSREPRRTRELRQVQLDRAVHTVALVGLALLSWQWVAVVYLPAFFIALVLVNVQNYYRHFGANPDVRAADSVSHYGRFYNLLALNDGYHQEHHLSPSTHWSKLPDVRERRREFLDAQPRIISPLPAMLGFLHRDRRLLHRAGAGQDEPSR